MSITEENFNVSLCKGIKTKKNPNIYNINELRNFLKKLDLPSCGNKKIIINRIINFINNKPYPIDCGGSGNCLFNVIARILQELTGKKYNSKIVRKLTANSINKNNIDTILENYLIEYKNSESDFLWNPCEITERHTIKEKTKELKSIINTDGFIYEGDDISLGLLSKSNIFKKYKLGIVIITDTCQISFIQDIPYKPEIYAIIYNIGNYHWQLVGTRLNKKKRIIFNEEELDNIFENFSNEWFQ